MKKSIFIALIVFTSIISCTTQPKAEALIGKYTFELLQKMDTLSQEEFNSHFISLAELREFAKDTTIEETFRFAIKNVSKETHNIRLQQAYEMIKESGKRFKIDWSAITFKEYPYTERDESGVTFQDGFVAFDFNDKKFVTKIVSLTFKNEQRLFNLSNIEPVRKQ
ncbi:hypothetical protein C8N46_104346 [Kordia periserrulae]|uniref:Uncharacterized protein n=1 Tax=Kordia periserrulae TaxID=701523 RepID=A0A2T6C059_9FLAO|nr:hypothetical protein [Kordia periserrulae]PTX61702.1 hypothetical protein C8N46_104346 [Kordia periserrulae]